MMYETIQPPFTLKFREMSKQELGDYGRWFHASVQQRISLLEEAVRATPGYQTWTTTYQRDSLDTLGDWFAAEVSTRPRTKEEMAELQASSALLSSPPPVELTNRSFSLAIDVGMYFARTLERAYPQLTWKQFLDNKRFADYGQPVLTGFGPVPLNPVRVAITLAYGIADGKRSGKRLGEMFDYWGGLAVRVSRA
jgi:hypothetical protein